MWRKAMVALGLQDDEDDVEFMGFDSEHEDDVQANSYAQLLFMYVSLKVLMMRRRLASA